MNTTQGFIGMLRITALLICLLLPSVGHAAPTIALCVGNPVSGSSLAAGSTLTVTITTSDNVTWSGGVDPTLVMDAGGTPVIGVYTSGKGGTSLVFTATLPALGSSDTLSVTGFSASPAIVDAVSNPLANQNNAASWSGTPALPTWMVAGLSDTTAPVITTVTGNPASGTTLAAGTNLTITVTGDEPLTWSGGTNPTLALNAGGTPVIATYISGKGTTSLVFTATIPNLAADTALSVTGFSATPTVMDATGNALVNQSTAASWSGSPTLPTWTVQGCPVLYAKPGGAASGYCDTWANACELRYALVNAISGQEIWTAAGTYTPTAGSDRTISFVMKSGVALYAGFAGTETSRGQRDMAANPTILSGDIGTPGEISDNSYHVVYADSVDSSAILDGFTVSGGNADFVHPNNQGGGMYIAGGSPTISNCTFSSNTGQDFGGGMYSDGGSPTISNCTFSGNTAGATGGGIHIYGGNPTISNSTFSGNTTNFQGGGVYSYGGSPVISNSTFSGNTAPEGGGMFIGSGSPTISNSTFSGNTATNINGGGMLIYSGNPTISNCTFSGNMAANRSGGMFVASGSPTISNSLIASNSAPSDRNCFGTIAGTSNLADDTTCGSSFTTSSSINLAPIGNYGGATQSMALLPGSSAIGAGNAATCTTTDQRGVTRGSTCDIGAYQSRGFTLSKTGGDNQSAVVGTGFAAPLEVALKETGGSPLPGAVISFSAPGSGASATLSTGSATTNASGIASVTATANGIVGGPYTVTATAADGTTTVSFGLSNYKLSQTIAFTSTAPTTAVVAGSGYTPAATGGASGNPVVLGIDSGSSAVCSLSGGVVTFQTAGTCTITANQAGTATYNPAPEVTQSFSVGKGSGTVTLGNLSQSYDGTARSVSITTTPTGRAVIISYSGISGTTYGPSATAPVNAGSYSVTATISDANYQGTATATLTVGKANQTITFGTTPAVIFGGTGTVSASGGPSGNAVTFTSTTPTVCSVSGATVTGLAAGTCTIAADQAGNGNYTAASQVTQDIPVAVSIALHVSALADGATTTETTQNVSGTVTNPTYLQSLTINGVAVTVTPAGSFSYPVQLIAGANTITVVANSTVGDVLTDSRTVTLDTTAPHLTISNPADNTSVIQQSITVTGTVTPATATTITCTINGGTPQLAAISGGDFTCTVTLGVGMNTILVAATDIKGNTAQTKRTMFHFTGFSLAITNPAHDIRTIRDSYTLTGSVTDNTSPVTITITIDGQTYTPTVTDGTFQQALPLSTAKVYQVSVTGTDQNSNTATVQRNIIRTVPLANGTAPAFSIVDALLALQMSIGLVQPQTDQILRMDVAPMVNGVSVGDGAVNLEDAVVILRMVVGLI